MSECGHDRIEAMYTPALCKRIGDTWASIMRCQDGDNYDTAGTQEELNPSDGIHKYAEILTRLVPDKNARILEVGAGDGSETRMFLDQGYKNLTGITVGRENCIRGKELYNVNLLFMDMHFTSFPNQSFDAIVGFQTYEHTPAPLLLGLEFNRLLRPGGKLVMEIPVGEQSFPYDENPHHLNVVEEWQGKNMLRKCGFVSITHEKYIRHNGMERLVFYGEKIGQGAHNNHFNDVVGGKFYQEELLDGGQ